MKKIILKVLFVLILTTLIVSGCVNKGVNSSDVSDAKEGSEEESKVTLLITKDYGKETILNKEVKIDEGYTVMDILEENVELDTKWGGDFISGINGIKSDDGKVSGKPQDWFYFVNGVCPDVVPKGYELSSNDVVWWDYHPWDSMNSTNSAVIGSYPEPFINGYNGKGNIVTIMAHKNKFDLAQSLKKSMDKVDISNIEIMELSENELKNRKGPTILLSEWNEIKDVDYIKGLNKAYQKTGLNVHFTKNEIEILKYNGDIAKKVSSDSGVIVAAGEGLGDSNPLWLIIGIDESGLESTVDVLINNPKTIQNKYGMVVVSGEIISLPIQ